MVLEMFARHSVGNDLEVRILHTALQSSGTDNHIWLIYRITGSTPVAEISTDYGRLRSASIKPVKTYLLEIRANSVIAVAWIQQIVVLEVIRNDC